MSKHARPTSPMHVNVHDFLERVVSTAAECGYDMKDQHPEDLAANLAPVMQAYAAGFGDGYRAGRRA